MELRDNLEAQQEILQDLIVVESGELLKASTAFEQAADLAGRDASERPAAERAHEAYDEQMDVLRRLFDADRHLRAAIDALQPDAD